MKHVKELAVAPGVFAAILVAVFLLFNGTKWAHVFYLSAENPLGIFTSLVYHISDSHLMSNLFGLFIVVFTIATISMICPPDISSQWVKMMWPIMLVSGIVSSVLMFALTKSGFSLFQTTAGASGLLYGGLGLGTVATIMAGRPLIRAMKLVNKGIMRVLRPEMCFFAAAWTYAAVLLVVCPLVVPAEFLNIGTSNYVGHVIGYVTGVVSAAVLLKKPRESEYKSWIP